MVTDNSILEVQQLTKEYKKIRAVDSVSFSAKRGEIVGLLGPNGAGKTTTINIILGILEPTAGTVHVLGKNFSTNRTWVLERTNFAATYAQLPGNLTVRQNLLVFGLLYGASNLKETINRLLKEFSLEQFAHTKTGFLSSGEQTRVNLAKAFLNKPRLILLDEPTASLDPHLSVIMRDKIRNYAAETGAAVLWTSHDMHEVEAVCDRVLFLSHGKILLEGNPRTLPAEYDKKNLEELFIAVAKEPLTFANNHHES